MNENQLSVVERALRNVPKDETIAISFTGGKDSFLTAYACLRLDYKVKLYIIRKPTFVNNEIEIAQAKVNLAKLREMFPEKIIPCSLVAHDTEVVSGRKDASQARVNIMSLEVAASEQYLAFGIKDEVSAIYYDEIGQDLLNALARLSYRWDKPNILVRPLKYVYPALLRNIYQNTRDLKDVKFWSCESFNTHRGVKNLTIPVKLKHCGKCAKCKEYERDGIEDLRATVEYDPNVVLKCGVL